MTPHTTEGAVRAWCAVDILASSIWHNISIKCVASVAFFFWVTSALEISREKARLEWDGESNCKERAEAVLRVGGGAGAKKGTPDKQPAHALRRRRQIWRWWWRQQQQQQRHCSPRDLPPSAFPIPAAVSGERRTFVYLPPSSLRCIYGENQVANNHRIDSFNSFSGHGSACVVTFFVTSAPSSSSEFRLFFLLCFVFVGFVFF